jgi:WD40 repeat protein
MRKNNPVVHVSKSDISYKWSWVLRLILSLLVLLLFAIPGTSQAKTSHITTIVWKPDGSQLAVGYSDGNLQIWNTATRQMDKELIGHAFSIRAVSWHPTENQLISSSSEELFLWDTASGQLITDLHNTYGFPNSVAGVTWNLDATQIIVFSTDITPPLQVWDAQTFQYLNARYNDAPIYSVIWSPDRNRIATATVGGVLVRDAESFDVLLSAATGGGVGSIAWSSDGQRIAASNWVGGIQIWDVSASLPQGAAPNSASSTTSLIPAQLESVVQRDIFEQPDYPLTYIQALAFDQDDTQVLSVGCDGTFTRWDILTGNILETSQLPNTPIYGAAFSPDGTRLAYGDADGVLHIIAVVSSIRLPSVDAF